jgi:hypothetical protein
MPWADYVSTMIAAVVITVIIVLIALVVIHIHFSRKK